MKKKGFMSEAEFNELWIHVMTYQEFAGTTQMMDGNSLMDFMGWVLRNMNAERKAKK